ncbi:MAG: hypothetical protein ACE5F1_03805 [Planctomycetota bacterium]
MTTLSLAVVLCSLWSGAQDPEQLPAIRIVRRDLDAFAQVETALRESYRGRILDTVVLESSRSTLPPGVKRSPCVLVAVGTIALRACLRDAPNRSVASASTLGIDWKRHPQIKWFFPLDLPVERRLDLIRAGLPDLDAIGVLLTPAAAKAQRTLLRAFARKRRIRLEIQVVSRASLSVEAIRRFGPRIKVVLLLPDRRTTPRPGSKLDHLLERELARRGLFAIGLNGEHLKSRSLLHLVVDHQAIGRELASVLMRQSWKGPEPASRSAKPRVGAPPTYRAVLHPDVIKKFRER